MPLPSKRGLPAQPPDKGSFPLDHFGACSQPHLDYLQCVKEGKQQTRICKDAMKTYLECRMQNGLMAKEDLGQLGFHQQEESMSSNGSSIGSSSAAKSTPTTSASSSSATGSSSTSKK